MAPTRRQRSDSDGGSAEGEHTFGSTTWEWKRVKMRRPPEANKGSGPKGLHAWSRLPAWPLRRRPLSVRISYRGGPECWYEVHARGRDARFTGAVQLHDLMRAIAGEQ